MRKPPRREPGQPAVRSWHGHVYNTTYTVSYGLVFPVAFVAQAIPRDNAAVRGFIDGAAAATRQVDQMVGRTAS